jgi:hypothetical protein
MDNIEGKFLQQLEKEAAQWVEEELVKRMNHAKEAIQEQVNISLPEIGPNRAHDHLKKALAFAEENLRMQLEFEAQTWIDEELEKRKDAVETIKQ